MKKIYMDFSFDLISSYECNIHASMGYLRTLVVIL